MTRCRRLGLLLTLLAPAGFAAAETKLWYSRPAPRWDHGLPLGNGRLGAVVFGDARRERIQLNESSLWMGGRRERDNPEALAQLEEVRRLLFAGQPQQAALLAEKKLMGRPHRLESYQTLGDLRLALDHEENPQDYRLELDLETAIARVAYRAGPVRFTREVFASAPDQVIVVRLTADRPGSISFSLQLDRVQDAVTRIGGDRIDLEGGLAGGTGLAFHGAVKVLADGGRLDPFTERLSVERADAVTLILGAATSFRNPDPKAAVERQLAAAAAKGYERLKADHVLDHQRLFRRVELRLGALDPKAEALPTDERLELVKRGERDLGLEALYFQLGRYLLIASSRPGGLPANLQGLWNDSLSPPWTATTT